MKPSPVVLALIAAASLTATLSPTAHGAFILKLATDASIRTIVDNAPGDADPTTGVIAYSSTIGNFSTSITVGTSNCPGTPTDATLQITSIDIHNTTNVRSLLTITLEDTDFTSPAGSDLQLYSSLAGTIYKGAAGDGVTFQSFVDTNNVQGGTLITCGLQSDTVSGPQLKAITTPDLNTAFTGATPFSMKNVTAISLSANAQANVSGTTTVQAVPEPASLGILALGIGGLLLRRRPR